MRFLIVGQNHGNYLRSILISQIRAFKIHHEVAWVGFFQPFDKEGLRMSPLGVKVHPTASFECSRVFLFNMEF